MNFRALVILPMSTHNEMYELRLCKPFSESHVYGAHLWDLFKHL